MQTTHRGRARLAIPSFIVALAPTLALGVTPSVCNVPKHEIVTPKATLTITTDALVKNDPSECSLLDAFQIVNDGANLGTNKCGTVKINDHHDVIKIHADGYSFDLTSEIFLGNNTALLFGAVLFGTGQTRVFRVASDNAHLMLEQSIIEDGAAGSGAGILVEQGASLSLYQVDMKNNHATTDGGAIAFQSYGTLIIEESMLTENTAGSEGGALKITGSEAGHISNSRIQDNSSDTGGGVYSGNADLDVRASYVEGNKALNGPGGGFYSSGYLSMSCNLVKANNAAQGDGGGLYLQPADSLAVLQSNLIEGNSAGCTEQGEGRGGGVFVGEDLTLIGGSIAHNNATVAGGGLYIDDAAADDEVHIENLSVIGNSTAGRGGGFWITGQRAIVDTEMEGFDEVLMGARYSFQIFNTTIRDNDALDAQIYIDDVGVASFDEILFLNNLIDHKAGLPGCAGYVDRLLPGRINDPQPFNSYNLQSPGNTCGNDIVTGSGLAAADTTRWLFNQPYARTTVTNEGDPFVCA